MTDVLVTETPASIAAATAPPVAAVPTKSRRAKTVTAVRFALSVLLLAVVIRQVGGEGIAVSWTPLLFVGLGVSAVLLLVAQLFSAIRWKLLLGEGSPPLIFLVRLCLVGQFFSLFLPSAVGGDALRMVMLARNMERPGEGVSSVFFDRIIGVLAMLPFFLVGGLLGRELLAVVAPDLSWQLSGAQLGLGLLVLVGGTAAALLLYRRSQRIRRLVAESSELLRRLSRSPSLLAQVAIWGVVVQGTYVAAWMAIAAGLGFDAPLSLWLVAVPLVSIITMLPIAISGVGLREGLWVLILAPFGIAGEAAIGFSLLYFAAFAVVGLVGGAWFALRGASLDAAPASLPAAQSCG